MWLSYKLYCKRSPAEKYRQLTHACYRPITTGENACIAYNELYFTSSDYAVEYEEIVYDALKPYVKIKKGEFINGKAEIY